MSAKSFEDCITQRTKAVIPVDLYGGMPDMDAIRAVASRHNVAIIEDAAEALGAEYRGQAGGQLRRHRRIQLPWLEDGYNR